MSNGIHPLRPAGTNPYVQPAAQSISGQPAKQAARAAAPDQAAPAPAPASAKPGDLSADEQAMIQELFPENGPTSMRLYGPGGAGREVQARAVGSRLDLSA